MGDEETTMSSLLLPTLSGGLETYALGAASPYPLRHEGAFARTVYAAAHVVADPIRLSQPWSKPAVDWDATLKFRHHLCWKISS